MEFNYKVGPDLEGDSEKAGATSRRKERRSHFLRAPKFQVSTSHVLNVLQMN